MNRYEGEPAFAGDSHIGLVRSGNEDAFLLAPPLFAVADGMGGHLAGEVASSLAIETLLASAPRTSDAKALARAVHQANEAVIQAAKEGRGRQGMGTTLTAVMLDGTRIAVAHVGDSRAYLLHFGRLQQLTNDHSLVADLVRLGQLTPEEARTHPNRSVITRALGSDRNMLVDAFELEAAPGDRLLIASDGLTSMVSDEMIERILATAPTPADAVDALIDAALDAGGTDNVTVIVTDIGRPAHRVPLQPGAPRWGVRALWILTAVAIVAAAALIAHGYARSRAYLIAEDGRVVLYQGVPGSFAGIKFSWLAEESTVPVSALDSITANRLATGIRFDSLEDAETLLDAYRIRASTVTTASVNP